MAPLTTLLAMPNEGFDWSLLRSFLAVLDHGSLLAAARQSGVSQPTLGRHIAELERQLDVVLFERTGRGLMPTAAASKLVGAAREMAVQADLLQGAIHHAKSQQGGTVRITASTPVAVHLLPPILGRMRRALPQVQVELVASNLVSNLLRREADIAVRMVRPDQGSLIARKIGEVHIGAYAHKDYLARALPVRSVEDLLNHDLIGGDENTTVIQGFKAMGLELSRESISFRSDDLIVQWAAVRAGLGIGFFVDYLAATDADVLPVLQGELQIRPLPMWLAVHREIRSSPRIRAVFDFPADELRDGIS